MDFIIIPMYNRILQEHNPCSRSQDGRRRGSAFYQKFEMQLLITYLVGIGIHDTILQRREGIAWH